VQNSSLIANAVAAISSGALPSAAAEQAASSPIQWDERGIRQFEIFEL
jgi:hypothetical protein